MTTPSGPPQKNIKCHIRKLAVLYLFIVTSIMAQNDILCFSEEDLRGCMRIGAPSLYAIHAIVRQSKLQSK